MYSKSEYTTKIGQCVRPAVRLHDNSFTITSDWAEILYTELSHQYLGRVRRWEWSVKKWLSYRKNCHYWPDRPWGGVQGFFQKKYFFQNYLKHIWIDSVFNADSEYGISFEPNRSFLTKHCLKKVSKCTKTVSRNQIA